MAFNASMLSGLGPAAGVFIGNQMAANMKPKAKAPGNEFFGLDPMTWLQISAALAQGASGGGWGEAAPGIAGALEGRKERGDEEGRSDAQKRALAAMQMGDTRGAASILASAKGLEGDALNYMGRISDREYGEQRDETLYKRDRGDFEKDRTRDQALRGWEHIRDRTETKGDHALLRGEQVADREDNQRHESGLANTRTAPNFEKVTDKDGKIIWVIPGTNIQVDSGIEAPGANSRSLLGAETAARAYAGIPGAMEAIGRMERMELGGVDAQGNKVDKYDPQADWGARAVQSIPFIPGMKEAGAAWGGEDFQAYEQAFKQFEATMMPIMSGAAVSESEAERLLLAVQPRMEDGAGTLEYKRNQRRRMVESLKAAAEGDRTLLNQLLAGDHEPGAAGAAAAASAGSPQASAVPQQLQGKLTPLELEAWDELTPELRQRIWNKYQGAPPRNNSRAYPGVKGAI